MEWSQNGSENWDLRPGETFEMTAKLIHLVSGTNYSLHVDVLIDNVTVVDTTEQFMSNGSNVGYGYDVTFPDEFCTVEVILILHDESTPSATLTTTRGTLIAWRWAPTSTSSTMTTPT